MASEASAKGQLQEAAELARRDATIVVAAIIFWLIVLRLLAVARIDVRTALAMLDAVDRAN